MNNIIENSKLTSSSFTPVLMFGGSDAGIEYSVQTGTHQLFGGIMLVNFSIALSSLGTATGTASITFDGISTAPNNSYVVGPLVTNCTQNGLSSISLQSSAFSTTFSLCGALNGGGGTIQLTEANLMAGNSFAFNGFYFIA